MKIDLNIYETMALVSVIFYLGKYIKNKITILSKYCVPPAVIGGFIFSIIILFFEVTDLVTISLDTTLQTLFMTAFFTSIGFTASFKVLKQGGHKVIVFLALALVLVILQNTVGVTLASFLKLSPLLGLCTASIPMIGGHGTAGSFGPILEEMGVLNATTISIASATFGLVMGSILGGLIAKKLITSHQLKTPFNDSSNALTNELGDFNEENHNILSFKKLMNASCFLFIAMGLGSVVSDLIQLSGLTFPSYIGAMIVAAIIRNIYDIIQMELAEKEIETLGGMSLSFFLTMALMGLNLWQLFDLALPLLILLIAQTVLIGLFAYFITFRIMGKNYEGAIFASATCGFGMGATPNAIANMDELTNQYGFVYTPYFVVPIVGGLFIDFINSAVITFFINMIT